MSLWRRIKGAWIGAFGGWKTEQQIAADSSVWSGGGWGRETQAGERVSPDSAMGLSAYFASIRNISEDIGKLPLITYRRLPRGKERAATHPCYTLLKTKPNPYMGSMVFRETMSAWALGWGRGCAEIVRDERGFPRQLWPIHPSRILPKWVGGELFYDVSQDDLLANPKARPTRLLAENVLHIHGLGDGYEGYSVCQLAAESIGVGLAAQLQAASYFGNGTQLAGILEHPSKLSQKAHDNLRASWAARHQGARAAFTPAILEEGMKWTTTGAPPKDAQFLETRQFQVEEIARWFRIAPTKIGDRSRAQGWSTLEAQNTDHASDTLMPWLVRWEEELEAKIFLGDPDYFAEHLMAGLVRGDMAARQAFYTAMFNIGVLSPNEIRELENMNPNPGPEGDAYYMQLNMTTAERVYEGDAADAATDPPNDTPDAADMPEETPA